MVWLKRRMRAKKERKEQKKKLTKDMQASQEWFSVTWLVRSGQADGLFSKEKIYKNVQIHPERKISQALTSKLLNFIIVWFDFGSDLNPLWIWTRQ